MTKVGTSVIVDKANEPAIGVTKDGVLIAGTANLVRDRLSDTWTDAGPRGGFATSRSPPRCSRPSRSMRVAVTLSPAARKQALASMGPDKNFATDLVARHKAASFSVFADGIGWTWIDATQGRRSMRWR